MTLSTSRSMKPPSSAGERPSDASRASWVVRLIALDAMVTGPIASDGGVPRPVELGRNKMKRSLPKTLCAVAVTGLMALPSHAAEVVKVQLRACPTGTAVGEVGSCGKIWKLAAGDASLDAAGNFKAMVKGLVLNDPTTGEFNGTADGVTHVVGADTGLSGAPRNRVATERGGAVPRTLVCRDFDVGTSR